LGHHPLYPISRSGRYILLPPRGNGTAFSSARRPETPMDQGRCPA